MEVRYFYDADTGLPHFSRHGIASHEVDEVLHGAGEDLPASNGSRMKLGQTIAGRYVQVIYVPDEDQRSVFVVTAYELKGKAMQAYRRRMRRKK